jgi:hypothetical protein
MFISQISVRRDGYFGGGYGGAPDASKPFRATIEVHGSHNKTELNLSPELSERIVAIIADEVAAAGRATAEAMVAEALTITALPAPKGKAKP